MSVPTAPSKKLHRVQWTQQLHERFMAAVNKLGDYAVPSKILKEMNVPGLTREQISSHLQKYRLKKDNASRHNAFFTATGNNEAPPATLSSMSSSFSVSDLGKRKNSSPQSDPVKKEKVGEDLDLLKAASHERLKTAIELYNRATSFSNIVNVPTTLTNNDLAITNLFNEVFYHLGIAEYLLKEQRNIPAVISILELITTTVGKESNSFIEKFVDEALKECGRLWIMVMLNWTGSIAERKSWYEKLKRMLAPYNISHEMFDNAAYAAFVGWEDENLIAILEGKQPPGKFIESDELLKCRAKVLRFKGAVKEAEVLEKLLLARIEESSQQQQQQLQQQHSPVKSGFYAPIGIGASRSPTAIGGTTLPPFANFPTNGVGGSNNANIPNVANHGGIPVLLPISAQQLPGMPFPAMSYPPLQFPQFLSTPYYSPPSAPVLFPVLPPPSNLIAAKSTGSPIELPQPLMAHSFSPSTASSQFSTSALNSAFLSTSPSSPSHASSSPSSSVSSSPVRDLKEPIRASPSPSTTAAALVVPPTIESESSESRSNVQAAVKREEAEPEHNNSSNTNGSSERSSPHKSDLPTSISNLTNPDTDKPSPISTTNPTTAHPETQSSEIARK